jgi:hypothetical protein
VGFGYSRLCAIPHATGLNTGIVGQIAGSTKHAFTVTGLPDTCRVVVAALIFVINPDPPLILQPKNVSVDGKVATIVYKPSGTFALVSRTPLYLIFAVVPVVPSVTIVTLYVTIAPYCIDNKKYVNKVRDGISLV